MKLRLSPYLMALVACASVSLGYSGSYTLSSSESGLQFTEDMNVDITSSLSYTDAALGFAEATPFRGFVLSALNYTTTGFPENSRYLPVSLIMTGQGRGVTHLEASRNTMSSYGGLFFSSGDLTFEKMGNITFHDNRTEVSYSPTGTAPGTLLTAFKGNLVLSETGDISILRNTIIAKSTDALLYAGETILFSNTGNIDFSDNEQSTGRALIVTQNTGSYPISVVFDHTGDINMANNSGGVIRSIKGILFANTGDITVSGNKGAQEGPMFSYAYNNGVGEQTQIAILQCQDVLFKENEARMRGGALNMELKTGAEGYFLLSADRGNIVFEGNIAGLPDKTLNSITVWAQPSSSATVREDMGVLDLRAQEGREITFYDPMYTRHETIGGSIPDTSGVATININAPADPNHNLTAYYGGNIPEFNGTVRFSGEKVGYYVQQEGVDPELSKYNDVRAITTLYGGTMIVEHEAVYGSKRLDYLHSKGFDTGFHHKGGTLKLLTGASIYANDVSFSGTQSIVQAENTAAIYAHNIDFSNGFTVDFTSYLNTPNDFGLVLNAQNLSLGGDLMLEDRYSLSTRAGWNDFYTDTVWASAQKFLILDTAGVDNIDTSNSDMDNILSLGTGGNVIDSEFTYNGEWSLDWEGDQLYAVWTPMETVGVPDPGPDGTDGSENPGISKVAPEMEGTLVMNSLWSSASNLTNLGNTAMKQIGLQRLLIDKNSNYWVSGLGDFTSHSSRGGRDGYEYNGGGYAVGGDYLINRKVLVGAAFGQLHGDNKSKDFDAKIKQDTLAGLLYGAWYKPLTPSGKDIFTLTGTAGYGWTDNKLKTYYSDGDYSTGKWDNKTWRLTLQARWDHALSNNWSMTPFAGIEYLQGESERFTEQDVIGKKARHMGKGELKNLSLPVGIAFNHTTTFSRGTQWINSISLSYVPDIYRDNPEGRAERLSNNQSWTVCSSRPARNTFKAEYNTRVQWNKTWGTFAGYELEAGSGFVYQRASLGVSVSF